MDIVFNNPRFLGFLLFVPIVIVMHYLVLRFTKKKGVLFANFKALERVSRKYVLTQNNPQLFVRVIIISFMVLALCGTTLVLESDEVTPNTILVVDSSDSMAQGEPPRLETAKDIGISYIQDQNVFTKLGLVSFSSIARAEELPTTTHFFVRQRLAGLELHDVGGTDVGIALSNAINMLAGIQGDKRVILLSDAQVSFGSEITVGLERAVADEIAIDSVVLGPKENSRDNYVVSALQLMGNVTGGQVYHFDDFDSIPQLTEALHRDANGNIFVDITSYLLITALVLITLEWALSKSIFKTIPYD